MAHQQIDTELCDNKKFSLEQVLDSKNDIQHDLQILKSTAEEHRRKNNNGLVEFSVLKLLCDLIESLDLKVQRLDSRLDRIESLITNGRN